MADNDFMNNSGLEGMLLPTAQPAPSPIQDFVPEEYRNILIDAANKHGISPRALGAMAKQESSFNPDAVGADTKWGTAKGMFQYLDSTARGMNIDPFDPVQAADAAAKQLADNTKKYGNIQDAFRAHHAGPNKKGWGPKTNRYSEILTKLLGGDGAMPTGGDAGLIEGVDKEVAADPRLMALLFAEAL